MQNIGERLEEARKRKGLSIREAAEATKIRGDFLTAFESNHFGEVPLPDIYKRGFLKNYSTFLQLDWEKILADYTAHQLGNSRLARKDGREFFGRMDMPNPAQRRLSQEKAEEDTGPVSEDQAAGASPTSPPTEVPRNDEPLFESRPSPEPRDSRFGDTEDREGLFTGDKTLYWKIGLAGGGAFVLFLLIFALTKAISGGGSPDEPTPINNAQSTSNTTSTTTPSNQGEINQVNLVGTGETFVQVKQISNGEILFKGTLSNGERVPLQIRGSADIAFTNGQNLRIIKDGNTFEPNTERSLIGKINTDNL